MKNSTYFENNEDSFLGFSAMNQEASDPLPCLIPLPGAIGMLASAESPWPVPLTLGKKKVRNIVALKNVVLVF